MCADQPGSQVMVEFKFSLNPFSEDSSITFPPFFFEELVEASKRRAARMPLRSAWVDGKGADMATLLAGEQPLFDSDGVEHGVGAASGAPDIGAAAGVATDPGRLSCLQLFKCALCFPRPVFCIAKLRFKAFIFSLKLGLAGFVLRQLGLDQGNVLAKNRRTAVLGYQALQRIEQVIHNAHQLLQERKKVFCND